MRPTNSELIASIVTALEQQVAPTVQDKWAASVLRSTTQLLNHIALRFEHQGAVLIADNEDVRQVLEAIAPRLADSAEGAQLHAVIEKVLQLPEVAAYDTDALDARNEAYQEAVEELLRRRERLIELTGDLGVVQALRAYLKRRLDREHPLYFPVFSGSPPI